MSWQIEQITEGEGGETEITDDSTCAGFGRIGIGSKKEEGMLNVIFAVS